MIPVISIQEAIRILDKEGRGIRKNKEILPLKECLGRFLAQGVKSKKSLPAFDNSAMDGYAVCLQDEGKRVKIIESIFAGDCKELKLDLGECVKIMTGAKVPDNANCIVPFEEIEGGFCTDGFITLPMHLKEGMNIRKKGEEILQDVDIFAEGEELGENHLAVFASQGISHVPVFERLKIGVFAGGNELKEPWEEASFYEVYNSNATMILSTLQKFGFFATYGGILEDKKEILKQTLQSPYDVIFTTGGASKGEADFMRMVLEESGAKMLVNGIKIKPGKPTMVAKLGEKFIIALPGNPLSAGVLLRLLVLPFLRQISGAKSHYPQVLEIKNANFMKLNNRAEVMLGRIGEHGFCLTKEGKYNSGEILPLAQSNAIALFDESCKEVEKGANVKILPYETLWGDSVCDIANH